VTQLTFRQSDQSDSKVTGTLFIGHPAVEAITYFGLTAADPPGYPKVCVLDEDNEPKPAWHRLRNLIREEWTTRQTASTNPAGEVRLRGFCCA